jgi:hypothetical protein
VEIVMHTHASTIVGEFFRQQLGLIHRARREVFCAAVSAVMAGHGLTLSRLARALLDQSRYKAALKRIDRLIGNARRIAQEAEVVGAALLRLGCRQGQPLVIAVDWSKVAPGGAFVELRAALVQKGMGRGLTLYQQVYPGSKLGNAGAERRLLECLHAWMPAGMAVILITDAGFRRPWFRAVERLGWSWIGRVRSGVCVSRDGDHWPQACAWFAQASHKACRWQGWLTHQFQFACDFVLYRQRALGRKPYGRVGHGSTPKAQREARARAREPWLLAHSADLRTLRPDEIVALYGRRMQIEENFRDSKSTALGMGLELSQSRSASRLQALLLIGTLAAFLLWHIGQLTEAEGLHLHFKATTRPARELSVITLARLLCALPSLPLTVCAIHSLYDSVGLRQ